PVGIVQQGAWIEALALDSHFSPEGGGEHEAKFSIINAGLEAFAMRLSREARDCRLVTDAGEQPLASVGVENQIQVPLPPTSRRTEVRVRYATSGQGLGFWPAGKFVTAVPQPDLPVLSQSWSVALPPSLAPTARYRNNPVEKPELAAVSAATTIG